ncbi:hypothetical protein F5884DRAFT_159208 [Xylogone sp. PMI_703]|nr:hypothetical protein F5884DRAFT_159208 [Xylogone sp. PMI_703]
MRWERVPNASSSSPLPSLAPSAALPCTGCFVRPQISVSCLIIVHDSENGRHRRNQRPWHSHFHYSAGESGTALNKLNEAHPSLRDPLFTVVPKERCLHAQFPFPKRARPPCASAVGSREERKRKTGERGRQREKEELSCRFQDRQRSYRYCNPPFLQRLSQVVGSSSCGRRYSGISFRLLPSLPSPHFLQTHHRFKTVQAEGDLLRPLLHHHQHHSCVIIVAPHY